MAIIDDPSAFYQAALYTGNDGTQAIVNGGNSDLQPDLVIMKTRNAGDLYRLYDSVRGANIGLVPNATDLEQNIANDGLTVFGSDGFTVVDGSNFGGGNYNQGSTNYVAWQWKTGTSFSNDQSSTSVGTIDSAGSVNTEAGIAVITHTGNGTANQTIAHGLGVKPDIIISKTRNASAQAWSVYHSGLGATKHGLLDRDNAVDTGTQYYADTEPTSAVFSVGTEAATNRNATNLVHYLFANTANNSFFSSGVYVGNGNVDGTFVYTGHQPAWILLKWADGAENWSIYDTTRNPINGPNDSVLVIDAVNSENVGGDDLDVFSNGFKFNRTPNRTNKHGEPYVWWSFAKHPKVTSKDNGSIPGTAF